MTIDQAIREALDAMNDECRKMDIVGGTSDRAILLLILGELVKIRIISQRILQS